MNPVNRAALYEPMKAYTRRTIEELCIACPQAPAEVLVGLRDWERVGPNAFALRDREEPFWVHCIRQTAAQRHAWVEYEAVESAIRADPLLSTQIEKLVGTAMGAQRREVDHIADALIWALARKRSGFSFTEEDFDQEFAALIDAQEATEIGVDFLAPLVGLKGDGFPLLVEPDLEIREFTDLRNHLVSSDGARSESNR